MSQGLHLAMELNGKYIYVQFSSIGDLRAGEMWSRVFKPSK